MVFRLDTEKPEVLCQGLFQVFGDIQVIARMHAT